MGSATDIQSSVCFKNHLLVSVVRATLRAPRSTACLPGGSRKGSSLSTEHVRGHSQRLVAFSYASLRGYSHNAEQKSGTSFVHMHPVPATRLNCEKTNLNKLIAQRFSLSPSLACFKAFFLSGNRKEPTI